MKPSITPSELRRNVYRVLDAVLESGDAQYVTRRGKTLKIVPVAARDGSYWDGPIERITDLAVDELADISWADAWTPDDA